MNKKQFLPYILTFWVLIANALTFAAPSSVGQPEDSFWLEIGDKKIDIAIDQPVQITVGSTSFNAVLKVDSLKTFDHYGIKVRYPRYFTFEGDAQAADVKMWNLSGAQTVLMIQLYEAEMDHKIMGELLQSRFGKENTRTVDCEMNFWGAPKKGTKVVTTIGDSSISQEIYSFFDGKKTVMLILQDNLNEAGNASEEGLAFRKILSNSFKIEQQSEILPEN